MEKRGHERKILRWSAQKMCRLPVGEVEAEHLRVQDVETGKKTECKKQNRKKSAGNEK